MSTKLSVLDEEWRAHGKFYSYPEKVSTTCSFGRPYHFWYAAFLARFLRSLGHSENGAFTGTHYAGIGYEFGSATWGRNANVPFTNPGRTTHNMGIQIGIVSKDLGALFGARNGNIRFPLDKDKLFLHHVARAAKVPPMSEDSLPWGNRESEQESMIFFGFYPLWRQIIASDVNMGFLRSNAILP